MIRVVGMLSNGMIQRRFQIDMPIVTQGIRGQDMMTRTHATISAISYGKRALEVLMFNLAIGDDDDGNAASHRQPYRASAQPDVSTARSMDELIDIRTGEVVEHVDPFAIGDERGRAAGANSSNRCSVISTQAKNSPSGISGSCSTKTCC